MNTFYVTHQFSVGAGLLAKAARRLHTVELELPEVNVAQVETLYQWLAALKAWQTAGLEDIAR